MIANCCPKKGLGEKRWIGRGEKQSQFEGSRLETAGGRLEALQRNGASEDARPTMRNKANSKDQGSGVRGQAVR